MSLLRPVLLGAVLGLGLVLNPFTSRADTIGPPNAVLCNGIATFGGASTIQTLVTAKTGMRVYICGWHVTNSAVSGTSNTFAITGGTQTTNPCDTGTITLTPALGVTQSAPSADHIDYAVGQTNIGQALCVTPSATTLNGLIYYSQF